MAYSGGIISLPVRISDVKSAVNYNSNNFVTLVSNGNINKFSKYKPVVYPQKSVVSYPNWWKGTDGHCGLSWTAYSDLSPFLTQLKNGNLGWSYARPTGGSSSPYRMKDFDGYYSDAEPPVGALGLGQDATIWVTPTGQGTQAVFDFDIPDPYANNNVTLGDLSHNGVSLKNFYLGVVLWKGNYTIVVTSTSTIGNENNATVYCTLGAGDVGDWKLLPFLSSVRIDRTSTYQPGVYISAGQTTAYNIHIKRTGGSFELEGCGISAEWQTGHTRIDYELLLKNGSGVDINWRDIVLYIYGGSATGTLLAQQNVPATVVHPDGQETVTGSFSIRKASYSYDEYWILANGTSHGYGIMSNPVEDNVFDPDDDNPDTPPEGGGGNSGGDNGGGGSDTGDDGGDEMQD